MLKLQDFIMSMDLEKNLDEKFGNVIGIWRSKVIKGEPLPIVGDGNQKEILCMFMI